LFVRPRAGSDPKLLAQSLGGDVSVVEEGLSAATLAERVLMAMHLRAQPVERLGVLHTADTDPGRLRGMTSEELQLAESVAVSAEEGDRPDPQLTPASSSSGEAVVDVPAVEEGGSLLEGHLDGRAGPALLVGLFSQSLTGQLHVAGGVAAGTLYLFRGEPVWSRDARGDLGLYRRLISANLLGREVRVPAVGEGELLASLAQTGQLGGEQLHTFMRSLVRDHVLALAEQENGEYRFVEDASFVDSVPLVRVNPFGLILEAVRRAIPPEKLVSDEARLGPLFLVPQPGLALAAERLLPFTRNVPLSDVVNGERTVRDVCAVTGLDRFMGTLVVHALVDARLAELAEAPRSMAGHIRLSAGPHHEQHHVQVEDAAELHAASTPEERAAREAVFALYARMKPLLTPRQILGVSFGADDQEIERAYAERLAELDPARIPAGPSRTALMGKLEELRRKVRSAHQALRMLAEVERASDTNPF
jgi:hypothetical protein